MQRAGQSVSRLCLGLLGAIFLFVVIILILTLSNVIIWLNFLTYCSYVKLGITLIKYVPQAYMNYRWFLMQSIIFFKKLKREFLCIVFSQTTNIVTF